MKRLNIKNTLITLAVAVNTALLTLPAAAVLSETETTQKEFRAPAPEQNAIVHVIEQRLDKFLILAARYNGYELKFSGSISGTLKNATLPMDLEKLLPRLANHYDLAWKIDDRQLFVSSASASETRVLSLKGLNFESLAENLEQGPIYANRFEVMIEEGGRFARLVAPPSYLDAIFSMAERLRNQGQ